MSQLTIPFVDFLYDSLRSPDNAAEYINASLQEENEKLLLLALRDVVNAIGMSEIAKKTGLNRENLYRSLSEEGNPRLSSLYSLLKELGLRLKVEPNSISESINNDEEYDILGFADNSDEIEDYGICSRQIPGSSDLDEIFSVSTTVSEQDYVPSVEQEKQDECFAAAA